MMTDLSTTPQAILRSDYRAPDFWVDTVNLRFDLEESDTRVNARIAFKRNPDAKADAPLCLHGEQLQLEALSIDGKAVEDYQLDDNSLTINAVPDAFILESTVIIQPQDNTSLSGLYQSSGNFCSQCEAEGFRRITYFLDRPDVMAKYSTTIVADKERYPVMLSNGNRISTEDLGDGRHQVLWQDPFPKPSYLFALVAGNLKAHRGEYMTMSGRKVQLEIWVEPQNIDYCEHALVSLQKSMQWDEQTYGLEYDLDIYMIVAVSDFNMGAMENKGLNVFNAKYVLSSPETATDEDYENIEAVIGHEYFHNWTGNRVTCRDWFQLTLKEGLTVYRDECFTADMTSEAVKRIKDVDILRMAQFPEDAGPMAHPIRPESYIEMNNFYTVSVYNKGAAVIRMYETLLGKDGFRQGMDLYFQRHDGHAVTCDDFRAAMADANGADLEQFERWYDQVGTPQLHLKGEYDAENQTYTLHCQQAPKQHQEDWQPWHIPLAVGLLDAQGKDIRLQQVGHEDSAEGTMLLEMTEVTQSFSFANINQAPTPSVLRHFSAPVELSLSQDKSQLAFLLAHDSDAFNRREAGQKLAQQQILELVEAHQNGRELHIDSLYLEAFGQLLQDDSLDGAYRALALKLPKPRLVAQAMDVIDVEALHHAYHYLTTELATHYRAEMLAIYQAHHQAGKPYVYQKNDVAARQISNAMLSYLASLENDKELSDLVLAHYQQGNNMTDQEAALKALLQREDELYRQPLADFYQRWHHDPLVLDKWFHLQAASERQDNFERVLSLAEHPDFTLSNPNRARSLINIFASQNLRHFHRADGQGYAFLADKVLAMDTLNPQTAARLVSAFNQWQRFDTERQALMRAQLQRIHDKKGLSKDVFEIVSRNLQSS